MDDSQHTFCQRLMRTCGVIGGLMTLTACTLTSSPAAQRSTPTTDEPIGGATIAVEGRVRPLQHIDLAFVTAGQVASVHVVPGDEVEADAVLVRLEDSALEANIRQQQAWVNAAQAQYDARPSGTSEAEERVLLAEIDRARAALDLAVSTLEDAQLRAPFAGTVLEITVAEGEAILLGQRILVLADTSAWVVETLDLQEDDAARVIVGHRARIEVPAVADVFDATVSELALSATDYQGSITYQATLDLDTDRDEGLRSGMTAYITIDLYSPLRPLSSTATPLPTNATRGARYDTVFTASPTPGSDTRYTVRSGDTLSGIARRYNVTVSELMRVNNLSDRNLIHPGLDLIIPAPQTSGG